MKANKIGFLLLIGLFTFACNFVQFGTRPVDQSRIITVEVTRIVRETPGNELMLKVQKGKDLPTLLAHHTVTLFKGGSVLIVGGSSGSNQHLANVERFNPKTNKFIPASPLHTPRHDHSATLLQDGRVLVIGGYNAWQQWLTDAEIYDPVNDFWNVIPPVYPHGTQHTATLMKDGRVLVVGGCIGSGICTEKVEIFDPRVNTWVEAASLKTNRASHIAQLLNDGRVLVAGGIAADRSPLLDGNATIYDPKTNVWSATAPIITPRTMAKSVLFPDGRVFVTGGIRLDDLSNTAIPDSEIYDPAADTWMKAANLTVARYAFEMALLSDGRTIVVGGARNYDNEWDQNSFVHEIEIYDPVDDHWQVSGEIEQPIAWTAVVMLPDDCLWVTGGQSGITIYRYNTWLVKYVRLR